MLPTVVGSNLSASAFDRGPLLLASANAELRCFGGPGIHARTLTSERSGNDFDQSLANGFSIARLASMPAGVDHDFTAVCQPPSELRSQPSPLAVAERRARFHAPTQRDSRIGFVDVLATGPRRATRGFHELRRGDHDRPRNSQIFVTCHHPPPTRDHDPRPARRAPRLTVSPRGIPLGLGRGNSTPAPAIFLALSFLDFL
jgi:hypothetical protein